MGGQDRRRLPLRKQEVRELLPDSEQDAMLGQADRRR
jgi:hypothetical protein